MPRYLLRFDDVCPTMNWAVWDQIEPALIESGIRPLVAVVPDNGDEFLIVNRPRPDFWERVRAWQARGWTIGVHGYQHRHITDERGLVGINSRSEFAGLSFSEQAQKLSKAVEIFRRESVTPEVWVAPFCSFDQTTISVLNDVGIRVISDGLRLFPHVEGNGIMWIPHQVWRFHRTPFGVWTVGCHINRWTEPQLAAFIRDLQEYRNRIVDVPAVRERFANRRAHWSDRITASALLTMIRIKRQARGAGLLKVPADAY
jgi:predicted deacetylase